TPPRRLDVHIPVCRSTCCARAARLFAALGPCRRTCTVARSHSRPDPALVPLLGRRCSPSGPSRVVAVEKAALRAESSVLGQYSLRFFELSFIAVSVQLGSQRLPTAMSSGWLSDTAPLQQCPCF